jgi:hypothetical protein
MWHTGGYEARTSAGDNGTNRHRSIATNDSLQTSRFNVLSFVHTCLGGSSQYAADVFRKKSTLALHFQREKNYRTFVADCLQTRTKLVCGLSSNNV